MDQVGVLHWPRRGRRTFLACWPRGVRSNWLQDRDAVGSDGAKPEGKNLFRATVSVVSLNVTVVDGQIATSPIRNEQDFSVFEDGTRQDLLFQSHEHFNRA